MVVWLAVTALAMLAPPPGVRQVLTDLATAFNSASPDCLKDEQRAAAARDADFLLRQLGAANPAGRPWQMPEAYRRSLLANHEFVRTGGCPALQAVADDLHVKRLDCEQSGAARTIRVRITTRRAAGEDPGWQLFSVWVPQSRLLVGRVPLKTLSNPAQGELVPGRYRFIARKGDRQVEGGPYSIYGQEVYPLEILIE